MQRKKKFRIPRKKIAEFCKRWSITEFSVFGSALRADFRPDSDVDVLVSINPKAHIGLFEIAEMEISELDRSGTMHNLPEAHLSIDAATCEEITVG